MIPRRVYESLHCDCPVQPSEFGHIFALPQVWGSTTATNGARPETAIAAYTAGAIRLLRRASWRRSDFENHRMRIVSDFAYDDLNRAAIHRTVRSSSFQAAFLGGCQILAGQG
jgi:hypothetical protein